MTDTHAEIMVKGQVVQALEWKHMDGWTDMTEFITFLLKWLVKRPVKTIKPYWGR